MQIEFRHLRYVTATAHHGSFRRAAEALSIKQSTLSRCISQLETRLGVLLFERSSGGVRLTRIGAEVMRVSQHLLETVENMAASVERISRGYTGQLTFGVYTSFSAGNLRASIVDFSARFPNVEIRIVECSRSRLFADLAGDLIDIAIVMGDPNPQMEASMPLWSERIMVALPATLPVAENNIVLWTDLTNETFLLSDRDPGPEILNILQSKLTLSGGKPKIVHHDASWENIRSLVGAGFGVSLMVEAGLGANYPEVVYREVRDGNGPSRISYAAHWRDDNSNPALANFIDLLKERYPSPAAFD